MLATFPLDDSGMIRVLLADDQALMRAGFRALLEAEDDLDVVGEAADGAAAVACPRRQRPDVVLMDVQMPGLDGIEATRRIAADPDLAAVRVLILTNYGLDSYVFAALRAGASGFLAQGRRPGRPAAGHRRGGLAARRCSPRRSPGRSSASSSARPAPADPVARGRDLLTAREQEIVELVARGLPQRRDRRAYGDQPVDRQDAHQPGDDEAPLPRPRPTGGLGLRVRPDHAATAPERVGEQGVGQSIEDVGLGQRRAR